MQNNKTTVDYKAFVTVPRRWFPLWRLDGYILREFMIKYSILMLVFIILFILGDVFDDIQDFLDARADWRQIVLYLLCKLPGNIRFILPITMLLGCMWTMAEFGKNLEVTAMRASGVSLLRCGGSIFAVGLIVTGIYIYFNETLIPKTQNLAEKIWRETGDRSLVSAYVFSFVGETLCAMTNAIDARFSQEIAVLYAGGVMSNGRIKRRLAEINNTYFSEPQFSSDNAAGVALLARRVYLQNN